MEHRPAHDRLLTVPNLLSGLRLVLIPVFIYLLLAAHSDGWAVAVLMFSGASDWADGKIARLLAAELPLLRTRGFTALPVIYIGKAATFALMSAFPLILLGHYDATWSRVILACGWAFLIWGIYFYLWSFVLYAVQVVLVMRRLPPVRRRREKPLTSTAEADG
jgi:phosphatidylglycerophosphate synthase